MLDRAYIFCKLYLLQLWCIVVFSVVCHSFCTVHVVHKLSQIFYMYKSCLDTLIVMLCVYTHVVATSTCTLLLHTVATTVVLSLLFFMF
jgi:hypothetical protein